MSELPQETAVADQILEPPISAATGMPRITGFAHQTIELPFSIATGIVGPLPDKDDDDSDHDHRIKRLKSYTDLLTSVVRLAKELGLVDWISSLWLRIAISIARIELRGFA
jgi:hypothetical protein